MVVEVKNKKKQEKISEPVEFNVKEIHSLGREDWSRGRSTKGSNDKREAEDSERL